MTLIETFACNGRRISRGSGFLVGTRVVMTARPVLHGACTAKVLADGTWHRARSWRSWYRSSRRGVDAAAVATIRLRDTATGHVFGIRSRSAAVGTSVSALERGPGSNVTLLPGRVTGKGRLDGMPTLAFRPGGGGAARGSAVVDGNANLVGIVQTGRRRSGATARSIVAVDLPSWWSTAQRSLCAQYPAGGIPGCGGTPTSPPPAPGTGYTVDTCWSQYTGASWDHVDVSDRTSAFAASDLLTRGPADFWSVIKLSAPPASTIHGVTATLVEPNGATFFADEALPDWAAGNTTYAIDFNWRFLDNSLFFQRPDITGQGVWELHWALPDGETCVDRFGVG